MLIVNNNSNSVYITAITPVIVIAETLGVPVNKLYPTLEKRVMSVKGKLVVVIGHCRARTVEMLKILEE